ncbi:MAG: PIG-L family deacetylase [Acidobacteriota bacterium]|nr:PIG-L family deacetylase [Acidobacteriota bacterium]
MPPTLLLCLAHPDDESFSCAGTVMKYVEAGSRAVLVTATLGERGKVGDPAVCSVEELPAYRERELREATAILGISELHLLGYRDRELVDAPPDAVRRALVTAIRRERPAVVFTFDPNGFNVHPDHVAISRFTSDAIAAAADPRWIPEAGAPYAVPRLLWTPVPAPWEPGAFDADTPGNDFVIDIAAWRDRKAAALRAHGSQHLSIDRCFFNQPELDRILSSESWRQAWGPALPARPATEIFAGM